MLVIGSGPGGAMTGCMAAEAGRDVLLVEEGAQHAVDSAPPFSLAEMEQLHLSPRHQLAAHHHIAVVERGRSPWRGKRSLVQFPAKIRRASP